MGNEPLLSVKDQATPLKQADLYSKRQQIYPKLAHGRFRMIKWLVMIVSLVIYYGLPWVRWPRGENIPDQAVLADFAGEKFYFFFIELWPQDIHLMAGGLIFAALALFLVTSILGRVWCGYACPQTVWTDLYIVVERFFEGDRAARMRLDRAPLSLNKITRKLAKHTVWLIIAFWTGGIFVLYWHDAPTVARGWFAGEAPLTAYWFAGILTLTTYFLAGTMREQVCTYMCPWPRIQGALTDENALNVTYRYDRGEPRAPKRKADVWDDRGDCIECNQCVQVCPVGIDIRDGAQLECIHCALCIDACDEIMRKIERPTGLIAYDTDIAIEALAKGEKPKPYKLLRPRTLLYSGLISVIGAVVVFGLVSRQTIELNTLKDRAPDFVRLSDGRVQNGYTVKLVNKLSDARTLSLNVNAPDTFSFKVVGTDHTGSEPLNIPVEPFGVDRYRVVIIADPDANFEHLTFEVQDIETGETDSNRVPFKGTNQ